MTPKEKSQYLPHPKRRIIKLVEDDRTPVPATDQSPTLADLVGGRIVDVDFKRILVEFEAHGKRYLTRVGILLVANVPDECPKIKVGDVCSARFSFSSPREVEVPGEPLEEDEGLPPVCPNCGAVQQMEREEKW